MWNYLNPKNVELLGRQKCGTTWDENECGTTWTEKLWNYLDDKMWNYLNKKNVEKQKVDN